LAAPSTSQRLVPLPRSAGEEAEGKQHDDPLAAIAREKEFKKWRRNRKIEPIDRDNSAWRDRFEEIASCGPGLTVRRRAPSRANMRAPSATLADIATLSITCDIYGTEGEPQYLLMFPNVAASLEPDG
jgi:hypothetical protein